jgi:CheY-like chemotaxis protein
MNQPPITDQQPVLYVEDEENDVFLMQHAWTKANVSHALQVVTDGEQALAYLAGTDKYANRAEFPLPCLVLLDLKLPRVGGLDVLQWIRGQSAVPMMPVIVLSSSNHPEDIRAAYTRGANSFIMKPPQTEGLIQMVASLNDFWLGRSQLPPVA